MSRAPRVAASILADDFACLTEVDAAVASGADVVHVDVMDEHDVPSLTVGPYVCAALRSVTRAPICVHLMVKSVDALVPTFADAGADAITFHPEASGDVRRTLRRVREHGCKAGLAFNPTTPLCVLEEVLDDVDVVLVTWVSPGIDGQRFMPLALRRIRLLRELIDFSGREVALAVDGGVRPDTAARILEAGADTLVAGSAFFGSSEFARTVAALDETRRWRRSASSLDAYACARRAAAPARLCS